MAGVIGLWKFRRTRLAEKASHLLRNSLFIWRTEHTGGVDAVLLGELAGTREYSSLVQYVLHGLEDALSAGCRRRIRVLLATHDHIHYFAQFHRRQILGLLNLIDF